jgi:hypothetical protein
MLIIDGGVSELMAIIKIISNKICSTSCFFGKKNRNLHACIDRMMIGFREYSTKHQTFKPVGV